jgi:endonuclease/exonuclease/phosphatase family metal-dependent hydrolase
MTRNAPYIGEAVVKRGLAKVGKTHTPGMCQKEIRQLFGVPSAGDFDKDGDADAHDAWKSARAHGQVIRDPNPKNAPRGSYLYFSGGRNGHVALGLGGGNCVSTDAGGRGRWAKIGIAAVAKKFGRKYEGYIVITGNGYRVMEASTPVKTDKARYEVTATVLNGRSGPGLQYPVKTKRAKGFQFDSTKSSGDWVRATSRWYHKAHLRKVVTEPSVTWRIGTLNIPLDAEKIPNGLSRAVIAAKQINAANLDIVAVQEIDRSPGGVSHNYIYRLQSALGSDWQLVEPTAAWNENYIFVRAGLKVTQHPDLILPSNAGGRHMTRVSVTKNKQTLNFGNTHLVSGAKNEAARTQQMQRIADHIGPDWIVAGDLNQTHISAALAKTHKTARTSALNATGANWNTYVKWGGVTGTKKSTHFLDHILAPVKAKVNGYTLVGIEPITGRLTQPRASDHLLVVASITR